MELKDIPTNAVSAALRKFDDLGRETMLVLYGNGPKGESTRWCIPHGGKRYDRKVTLRAVHELAGLGLLPPGRGTFTAADTGWMPDRLGFQVADGR